MTKRYRVSEIMAAIVADSEAHRTRAAGWSRAVCAMHLYNELRARPTSIEVALARWPTWLRTALDLRTGCTLAGRPLVSDAEVCDALVAAARRYGVPLRRCKPLWVAS